jgi:hypothetical protein
MRSPARFAVSIGAALAFLAGCGTSQLSIAARSTTPISAVQAAPGKSWMKPGTSGSDLLYVTATEGLAGVAYVYSLPQRELVGQLTGFYAPNGSCVDGEGNVFIVAYADSSLRNSAIYEYAHGGTTPINTLSDPGDGWGCASDPMTGNLAVANITDSSNENHHWGDIAIYTAAMGTPTIYSKGTFFAHYFFCGYDNAGNLYVSAQNYSETTLAWLPRKKGLIESANLDQKLYGGFGLEPSVQRDGAHMTVTSLAGYSASKSGILTVFELAISKAKAKIIRTTQLLAKKNRHRGETWIFDGKIAGINVRDDYGDVSVWPYPKGGKPNYEIRKIIQQMHGEGVLRSVTVSQALSRHSQPKP